MQAQPALKRGYCDKLWFATMTGQSRDHETYHVEPHVTDHVTNNRQICHMTLTWLLTWSCESTRDLPALMPVTWPRPVRESGPLLRTLWKPLEDTRTMWRHRSRLKWRNPQQWCNAQPAVRSNDAICSLDHTMCSQWRNLQSTVRSNDAIHSSQLITPFCGFMPLASCHYAYLSFPKHVHINEMYIRLHE